MVIIVGEGDSKNSDGGYRVNYDEDVFWVRMAHRGVCELVMLVIISLVVSGSDVYSKDDDSVQSRVITVVEMLTRPIKNCATYVPN